MQDKNVKIQGNLVRVHLSGSFLKFQAIYKVKKLYLQLLILSVIAFFWGLLGVVFVQFSGLYDIGIASISQGLARLADYLIRSNKVSVDADTIYNVIFWLSQILINIPLFVLGWYKISKKFTLLTLYFVVVSNVFGFAFSYIPGVENFFLFANLTELTKANGGLEQAINNQGVQLIFWEQTAEKQISLMFYALIWGFLQAVFYSVILIIDASSGGLDFLAFWYSEKKHKDIGGILFIVNTLSFLIGYTIGTYLTGSLLAQGFQGDRQKPFGVAFFLSPNLVFTIFMNIILGIFTSYFFPKYQFVKVEVYGKHIEQMRNYLLSSNQSFAVTMFEVEGGYSRQKNQVLVTNCLFTKTAELLEAVRRVDPDALFSITFIKKLDGYIYERKAPDKVVPPVKDPVKAQEN
ncbi:YitT family protein [Mycoplasmoides pneumoniae]|uniref:YitT family protein n=1 Tax=Mycoplasmoides pneumoniae TaxID=2104 RepID=UPI0006BA2796|nr:YitT family protein [Mycoplasmoides pneumoniae]